MNFSALGLSDTSVSELNCAENMKIAKALTYDCPLPPAQVQPRSQGPLLAVPWNGRGRYPGKRWSCVSQNLGDDKT